MTTTHNETERAEFEKWHKRQMGGPANYRRDSNGDYERMDVEVQWWAWLGRAALLSSDAKPAQDGELPPLPKPFMELHEFVTPVMYNAWAKQMRDYARSALLAAYKPAESGREAVGSLTVSHYKGLENRDFDYFGSLPDGTYSLYTKPQADKVGGEVADAAPNLEEIAEQIMRGMRSIGLWDARKSYCVRILRENFYYAVVTNLHPQPSALPDDVVKDAEKFKNGWQAGLEMAASNWETWYGFDKNGAAEMCREIKHDYAAIDAAMLKEGKS